MNLPPEKAVTRSDRITFKLAAKRLFNSESLPLKSGVAPGDRWIDSLPGPVTTSSHIFPRIKTIFHSVDSTRSAAGEACLIYSVREVGTPWFKGEEPFKKQSRGIKESRFLFRASDGCLLRWESSSRIVCRGNVFGILSVDDIIRELESPPEVGGKITRHHSWNEQVDLIREDP